MKKVDNRYTSWPDYYKIVQDTGTYRQLYFAAYEALKETLLEFTHGHISAAELGKRAAELQVLVAEMVVVIERSTGIEPEQPPGGPALVR